MNKTKMIAKDGTEHTDIVSYERANKAYDIQRAEHQSIEKKLEIQNNIAKKQLENDRRRLEIERENKDKEIQFEREKMYFEEKMRIKKLFDDIGMSKETFDDFVEVFFDDIIKDKINIREQQELFEGNERVLKYQIEKIKEIIDDIKNNNIESFYNYCSYNDVDLSNQILPSDICKMIEKCEKHPQEYIEEFKSYKTFNMILELKNNKYGIKLLISLFGIDLAMALGFISEIMMIVMFISSIILSIYFISKFATTNTKIMELIDILKKEYSIQYFKDSNIKILEEDLKNKENEYKIKLKDNENINKKYELDNKKKLKKVSNNWKDFIDFRKNHYNMHIEKILIETGFKDDIIYLDLDYPKINSSNKIKDGTIEDYIAYFENFI